jgi:hypothetical protein
MDASFRWHDRRVLTAFFRIKILSSANWKAQDDTKLRDLRKLESKRNWFSIFYLISENGISRI